uniref:hypothetical protein n=1 Tax=Ruegeria jejuensis TaxID=3233338 RepID=UPI00355AFE5F
MRGQADEHAYGGEQVHQGIDKPLSLDEAEQQQEIGADIKPGPEHTGGLRDLLG